MLWAFKIAKKIICLDYAPIMSTPDFIKIIQRARLRAWSQD